MGELLDDKTQVYSADLHNPKEKHSQICKALPKTKQFAPKHRQTTKRKLSSFNHPFSGAFAASFRVTGNTDDSWYSQLPTTIKHVWFFCVLKGLGFLGFLLDLWKGQQWSNFKSKTLSEYSFGKLLINPYPECFGLFPWIVGHPPAIAQKVTQNFGYYIPLLFTTFWGDKRRFGRCKLPLHIDSKNCRITPANKPTAPTIVVNGVISPQEMGEKKWVTGESLPLFLMDLWSSVGGCWKPSGHFCY